MEELRAFMVDGGSLLGFCRLRGLAYNTVRDWIDADEDRAASYARAREDRADVFHERIVTLARDPVRRTVQGNLDPTDAALKRLEMDALKWSAARMHPRRYGDKVEVEAKVTHDVVGELRGFLQGSRLPIQPVVALDKAANGSPLVREIPG
jgi:hypothetical protein